ncbi:hypothetical protein UFOVP462_18 [uncultured Caudovirales phage]|uniref:Uncharacterized protein n=1 Tax=uncultured Caudovirales phage TaxID=2100421 RepID=A0A6J5ME64_9CAUD|nr:hypothetical protein UFOVP462_18 [uncultured Caudovirales phage]
MDKFKYILTVIIILCTITTYAQPVQYTAMTASGYQMKRLKVDSTSHLPSFCGVPTLRGSTAKEGALAIDTCGGYLYMWTNLYGWDTINVTTTGGGGNQDLQSVLNNGNTSYNRDINLLGRSSGNQIYISPLDNNWMPFMALGDSIGGGLYQYTYPQATIEFINKYMSQKLKGQDSIRATIYLPTQAMDATDTIAKLSDVRANTFDSTSLSNRINLKLSISDTASMLSSYSSRINGKLNISDTANKWVNSITRTSGKDSIIYFIGGTRYAIKDSVGTGGGSSQNGRFGNDTATIVMVKVHNDAGVTLTNGKVVALTTSGNNNEAPAVRLANNKGDSTSANTLGFVTGTIANQDTGWVILSGKIEKLNTSAFSNGDIVYLDSVNGNWTKTKPQAPYHMVYLGVVVKSNAGNGSIYVKCQNGYELDEIHDVKITSPLNNQIIAYSDTQRLWKNRNVYSIVDTTNTIATKSNVALKLNISDTASMLSSYSTRINGKLNIADTSTLQRKSIPAYSIMANATSVTANVTAQQFRDTSGTYSGTITWTGTTAPSGATTHTYRLTQVGKCVTIHFALVFATNGAGLTAVQMTLPAGAPTPAQPTGLTGALANMYPINGQIANVANTIIAGQTRGFLRNNTAGNGYEVILNFQTAALGQVGVIAQYWTN